MDLAKLRKLAGMPITEGKVDAEYKTAAQGKAQAEKDFAEGWYEHDGDDKALRKHLKMATNPSQAFIDQYVKTMKALSKKKVAEGKDEPVEGEEKKEDELPSIITQIAGNLAKKFGIGDPEGGESDDLTAVQDFLMKVYTAGVADGKAAKDE